MKRGEKNSHDIFYAYSTSVYEVKTTLEEACLVATSRHGLMWLFAKAPIGHLQYCDRNMNTCEACYYTWGAYYTFKCYFIFFS